MAVKDGILAILSLGPGYGLALRDEIVSRAPHRSDLNVGQVYSTLDRLVRAGLVGTGTVTDDNLPLYTLTADGAAAVTRWLQLPVAPDPRSWADMMDQVLIGSSLPGTDWSALLDGHDVAWRAVLAGSGASPGLALRERIAAAATKHWTEAALGWIDETRADFVVTDPALPLRGIRPQRGRRPTAAATPRP